MLLRAQLAKLRRLQFGCSSEKLDAIIARLKLALEDLEEESSTRAAALPPAPTASLKRSGQHGARSQRISRVP